MTNAELIAELAAFDPAIYKRADDGKPSKFVPGFKIAWLSILSDMMTTMALENASNDEILNVAKYAYVIVDAEKCNLDYEKAYEDFNIADLKKRYFKKEKVNAETEDRYE